MTARRLAHTRGHGVAALAGIGVAFAAVLAVRADPAWFGGGGAGPTALLFVSTALAMLAVVLVLRRLVRLGGLTDAVGTVAASALVADGLLMAFAPGLYGQRPGALAGTAAWLLFGSGAALGFAVLLERRAVEA